jgi:DNA-binding NtrC family response regulator
MAEILLVEDEASLRESIRISLSRERHSVEPVGSVSAALERLARESFDLVVADLRLPDGDALQILRRLQKLDPAPASIVMTAHGSIDTAVEAMHLGAFDFIPKPFGPERLITSVNRCLENRRLRAELRRRSAAAGAEFVGESQVARGIRKLILQATEASTVLVTGETGTGKGLVARGIHRQGNPDSPFVVIHCGALPESLVESELFGHVKGAFSGATAARQGLLAEADGGTAFLDEVGEIPLPLQTRLLRFLESGEIRSVGADHSRRSHCQVIAATNRDLSADVRAGRFRQDLLYRLDVFRVHVPPLRERLEDLPLLCDALLGRIAARLKRRTPGLAPSALSILESHPWPGNVRELAHTLERALLLSKSDSLPAGLIEACMGEPERDEPVVELVEISADQEPGTDVVPLAEMERVHILETLERFGGDRSKTARALGIARSTLRRKLIGYNQ